MARIEKEKAVDEIADKLSSAAGVYLADFQGLNVEDISELRSQLRDASVEFKVIKNTLARLSVNKAGFEDLIEYLNGPTAMAFCSADPILAAKILSDFKKKNENLGLKACVFDGQVYDEARIKQIAQLPAKEQIMAQTVAAISGPLRNFVWLMNGLLTAMVSVLDQIKKQKEN